MAFADAVEAVEVTVTNYKLDRLLTALDSKESDSLRELLRNPALSAGKLAKIIRAEGREQKKLDEGMFNVSDKTIYRWREVNEVPNKTTVTGL